MSEVKTDKSIALVETRIINTGSPFKRFAVVRVGGRNSQSFRAWFDTFSQAENAANEYAGGEQKGLYFVLEVQAGLAQAGEFDRKLADIAHNHFTAVKDRKDAAKTAWERAEARRVKKNGKVSRVSVVS